MFLFHAAACLCSLLLYFVKHIVFVWDVLHKYSFITSSIIVLKHFLHKHKNSIIFKLRVNKQSNLQL